MYVQPLLLLNIHSSVTYLFFFMMCSKGLKKSFWKRKLASSPFSKNFMESCLSESTAKMATSSLGLQPTYRKTYVSGAQTSIPNTLGYSK